MSHTSDSTQEITTLINHWTFRPSGDSEDIGVVLLKRLNVLIDGMTPCYSTFLEPMENTPAPSGRSTITLIMNKKDSKVYLVGQSSERCYPFEHRFLIDSTKSEQVQESNVSFYFRARYSSLYVRVLRMFIECWRPKAHTAEIFIKKYGLINVRSRETPNTSSFVEDLPYNYSILWFSEAPAVFLIERPARS